MEYKYKSFDEYYDEAIIKPQHEEYTAKVNRIGYYVIRTIILGCLAIKLIALILS